MLIRALLLAAGASAAAAFAAGVSASAAAGPSFNFSNLFSDDAVLQRDKPSTIWGWALSAGAAPVTATWVDGAAYSSGAADAAGLWRITFPAALVRSSPFDLLFTGADGSNATLARVLLGDVFLCAGQSNVGAVQVSAMWNVSDMIAAAASMQAGLRLQQVSGNAQSAVPLTQFPTSAFVPWQPPLGAGGENGTLLGFSAVCYILGSTLYAEHLARAVPVGLVHSSHGGTSIQAWASPAAATSCGDNANSWNSSVLYNSNFHPLTVGPSALAGIYYYQGEQDTGIGSTETFWRASWYGCMIRALVRDWRAALRDATLPWVEQHLHAWLHTDDAGLATMRAAQLHALAEPRTALSTAFDGGDPAAAMAGSPGGTVHSHAKFIPGRRAAAAFAGAFYNLSVPFRNPRYARATALGVSNATHTAIQVAVELDPETVSTAGLVLRGWEPYSNSSHCPTERAVNASYCDWFAIQVNDAPVGSWHNASVALSADGRGLVLAAAVPGRGLAAVATRNGWSDWPVVTVYSAEGLPLMPWLRPVSEA